MDTVVIIFIYFSILVKLTLSVILYHLM